MMPFSRRKLRGPHLALGEIHCFPQEVAALCLLASLLTGKGEGVFFVAVDFAILSGNYNRDFKIAQAIKLFVQVKGESFAV